MPVDINISNKDMFLIVSNFLYVVFDEFSSLYTVSNNFFTSFFCNVFGNFFSCLNLNFSFVNGLVFII